VRARPLCVSNSALAATECALIRSASLRQVQPGVAMKPIQVFFLAVALIAALILYIAAFAIPEPPLTATLFAREPVTVTASDIKQREANSTALPVIDVRNADGEVSLLQGYQWMDAADANQIIAAHPVGAMIEAPRWDGKFWRGLAGVLDWVLLILSLFASVVLLFALRVLWKLRGAS